MTARTKPPIQPLPFGVYLALMGALVLAGMADAVYLITVHYRVYTDIGYQSFCALSKAINCDTVAQSPYAVFLGAPVAFWGFWGYALFGALLLLAGRRDAGRRRLLGLLVACGAAFCLVSVLLALISTFEIRSHCIMCLLSFAVNFLLLFSAWITRRRFDTQPLGTALGEDLRFLLARKRLAAAWGLPLLALALWAVTAYPAYWQLDTLPAPEVYRQGMTADGHPWIGAENPDVEIVEFSDYLCFQCRKMHFLLRGLVARQPDRIRLVHRHFPMDHKINPLVTEPFHVGSAKMALMATYAAQAGRFWEVNDLLFANAKGREILTVAEIAAAAGLDARAMAAGMYALEIQGRLRADIREGLQLGLTGTPGFLIEGRVYEGQIPAEIMRRLIP